jgi:hypothetical protein
VRPRTLLILGVLSVTVAGCGEAAIAGTPTTTSAPATATGAPTPDPASLLTQRDGATNVAPYAAALNALQPACTQDRAGIAGLGDAGLTDLEKNGIRDETRLTVLQHLRDSIPASGGRTDCAGVLAAYLVLRESPGN